MIISRSASSCRGPCTEVIREQRRDFRLHRNRFSRYQTRQNLCLYGGVSANSCIQACQQLKVLLTATEDVRSIDLDHRGGSKTCIPGFLTYRLLRIVKPKKGLASRLDPSPSSDSQVRTVVCEYICICCRCDSLQSITKY
jgi:hypothetical protein